MEEIQIQLKKAIEELIEVSKIKKGQIFLIGCSTSEVCGYKIGSHSAAMNAPKSTDLMK